MKIIYVVTRGSYSDYSVCAVFDSKEMAQKYIDAFNSNGYADFNDIEEYELNPNKVDLKQNKKAYFLRINKGGVVSDLEIADGPYGFSSTNIASYTYLKDFMNVYCFAKDEKQAIKIANDRRSQAIALNRWGEENMEFAADLIEHK